ncbi:MAG TPA: glycosyltransferase [Candidatus Thermoplasmatota archaeon]
MSTRPDVSIIIPSKNDERVAVTLAAIGKQATVLSYEVLVIDSSTGDNRPKVEALVRRGGGTYVFAEANVAQALRLGVEQARADIVITVPADAQPQPGWLTTLVGPVRSETADWAAGPALWKRSHRTPVAYYFALRTDAFYRRVAKMSELPAALPGWNTAYRRSAVLGVGNFDGSLLSSEDWDLHLRLKGAGHPGVYVPDAAILHDHPHTFRQLYRRERWYKRGQLRVARKHGQRIGLVELATPAAYTLLLLLIPLSFLHPWIMWATIGAWALLILRQMASGLAQKDPYFFARPLLRLLEGVAGIAALRSELLRRRT